MSMRAYHTFGLPIMIAMLLIAGCARAGIGVEPAPNLTQPFSLRIHGGDGLGADMTGYTHGYQAGQPAGVNLALKNESQAQWQSSYCLLLLNHEKQIANLAQGEFDLQPGESDFQPMAIRIPGNLAEGVYGLALVVPERFSTDVTIHVGNNEGANVAPWPTPAGCR